MIQVIYDRAKCDLKVNGHAGSGEVGHDLVCASTSILAYTLASFVKNMKEAGQVDDPLITFEKGDVWISCDPPRELKPAVILVFDAICGGFELLARDYHDNISYEKRGKI